MYNADSIQGTKRVREYNKTVVYKPQENVCKTFLIAINKVGCVQISVNYNFLRTKRAAKQVFIEQKTNIVGVCIHVYL